jgi:putative Holliday junction resolvase
MIPGTGRVMALDWGQRRIGVAISDETQLLASPLAVFTRRAGKRLPLGDFLTLVEQEKPVGLVVGLALDDDGREGDAAMSARAMGEQFATRASLPVDYVDESFTTSDAIDRLTSRGVSPSRRAHDIDALAAAMLLEQWLAARR